MPRIKRLSHLPRAKPAAAESGYPIISRPVLFTTDVPVTLDCFGTEKEVNEESKRAPTSQFSADRFYFVGTCR